ncbi:MAG: thioredoxin domain-containing protein, partial [Bacteroidota bacterium]
DQLGGGFARYTVDGAWLVPHFEKMLYDNALLVKLLADAYRQQPSPVYRRVIEETLTWVEREMTNPEGGFYSALDADSEGEEGKFYVWSKVEIDELLGDESPLFCALYGVSEEGNWEGKNILWLAQPLTKVAADFGITPAEVYTRLLPARERLFAARAQRIHPGLDDKTLLNWNALMISAYCTAYHALGQEVYKEKALAATRFIQEKMTAPDGHLWHTYKDGQAQYADFLDDYAYYIAALLDVYSITFETRYIDQAQTFTDFVLANVLDKADNLFYFTAENQQDIPLRRKELYDNALPSGNSTMILNLQRLGVLLGKNEWRAHTRLALKPITTAVERYPTSFGQWARAALYESYPAKEVAIVGPTALALGLQLQREYHPHVAVMAHEKGDLVGFPLLEGRETSEQSQIFVCQDYMCQLPVDNLADAKALL